MSDDPAKIPSPFDVRTIEKLIDLMSQHDMTEVDLREGDLRIRLRRGRDEMPLPMVAPPLVNAITPVAAPAAKTEPEPATPAKPTRKLLEIKSPTPGTFYASSSPDAEPYVRVGAQVSPKTVVCLVEAMKTFNPIEAECSGTIAEICVQNGQGVDWGQVLFRVDPSA